MKIVGRTFYWVRPFLVSVTSTVVEHLPHHSKVKGSNPTTPPCTHRYQKSLNRLLTVCYVPATSAVLIAFFSPFLLRPLTVLMKRTRQPVCTIKQSIYLDVYACTRRESGIKVRPSMFINIFSNTLKRSSLQKRLRKCIHKSFIELAAGFKKF